MTKGYKGKLCAYCNERIAVTGDHIVARKFFPNEYRANLPQAPICVKCNTDKSALENYAMTVFPFGSDHPAARERLWKKVGRRLAKNKKIASVLRLGAQHVWVQVNQGIAAATLSIPFDWQRVEPLFQMIVRGLVWYQWSAYVPNDYIIKVMPISRHGFDFFQNCILSLSPDFCMHRSFANGAFNYTATRSTEDSAFTAWHISLYGKLNMVGAEGNGDDVAYICAMTGPKSIEPLLQKFLSIGLNKAT